MREGKRGNHGRRHVDQVRDQTKKKKKKKKKKRAIALHLDQETRLRGGALFGRTHYSSHSVRNLKSLVILDYIMRNTDRGLDNWMIKVDWEKQDVSIVSDPPQMNASSERAVTATGVSLRELTIRTTSLSSAAAYAGD